MATQKIQPVQASSLSRAERIRLHKQKMRRRKRQRDLIVFSVIMVFVVAAGSVLSLTVFFKVSGVYITGSEYYSDQEVLSEAGIALNSNMFRINTGDLAAKLEESLPYIGKAEVKRALPDGISISITDTRATLAVEDAGFYTLLDDTGKALETHIVELPEDVALLRGVSIYNLSPGENITSRIPEDGEDGTRKISLVKELVSAVRSAGFEDVTAYDVSDNGDIRLVYQDRLTVLLGSSTGISQKLRLCKRAIEDENIINPYRTGVVDVTRGNVASVRREFYETMPAD